MYLVEVKSRRTRKPEGRRLLRRPRHRQEDNFKICPKQIEMGSMDWIILAQDTDQWRAIVKTVMNTFVP
jgi:hypothetical protein